MQGAGAEGGNRGSPSTMEKADESANKARLELPNGHVKQEVGVHHAVGGDDGGAIVPAEAGHGSRVELAVKIDMSVLHCPLCTLPFKPPVFQCNKGGHLACGGCVALLPGGQCRACEDGGGFFSPCPALDAIVSSTKIVCPNAGCQTYVPYHEAADHRSACPHAPCHCTEPGCGFVGAPQALAGHLVDLHSVPVRTVQYGRVSQVPVSGPRQLLVAEEDGRSFLLTVGALGAAAAAVSVVCVRASASTQPRFSCKMWVNLVQPASGGRADMVLVDIQMRSSATPGAVVAVDEPTFLAVPRMYMVPVDGDAASMEVPLNIRVDKISR
ncbi:putative E3 ubiquitin-protein ligase SINA-like 6 [Triticum dicoccoides]|uniref:putative E3 ubiquitin-protein ligase SINA-like 6 n=1 Tax=Triticum dicoccoides TaxID=85692 RepID=UPI00188E5044|nr:putative E3 ubiquitin-protein ligase SINA-like 6 [Triticum dicoccoides]